MASETLPLPRAGRKYPWQVFIDTNVLIAGLLSPTGASGYLLDLGEAEEIVIAVSPYILSEADRVLLTKFPRLIELYRVLVKNLKPLLVEDPPAGKIREAEAVIDLGDAPILASAKLAAVDYLVTLDTKHFHTPKVRAFLPIPILKPAQFLVAFRDFWESVR